MEILEFPTICCYLHLMLSQLYISCWKDCWQLYNIHYPSFAFQAFQTGSTLCNAFIWHRGFPSLIQLMNKPDTVMPLCCSSIAGSPWQGCRAEPGLLRLLLLSGCIIHAKCVSSSAPSLPRDEGRRQNANHGVLFGGEWWSGNSRHKAEVQFWGKLFSAELKVVSQRGLQALWFCSACRDRHN